MSGMIYTFYSYKGGVGRSMALANIGAHFFRHGFTTLLIDWDLEAPGLELYFEERYRLDLPDVSDRPGLCDMLRDYMEALAKPAPPDEDESPYPPLSDYLYELDKRGKASFWLMHAGRRAEGQPWQDYAGFVQTFDWTSFYNDWEGGAYLEWLREALKKAADVVLIDSRTGVTEMGGVATQHLADVVVLFCGTNLQNIENTARMGYNFTSEAVQKARGGRPLDILVVPSRIDDADNEGFREFVKRFDAAFDKLPMRALDEGDDTEKMRIPYLAHYSYKEMLIVGDAEAETGASRILEAYRSIAANMKLLAGEKSAIRAGHVESGDSFQPKVFVAYAREDYSVAQKIMEYLRAAQVEVRSGDQRKVKQQEASEELTQVHSVLVLLTKATGQSKSIQRVVQHAEMLSKPIIPLVVEDCPTPMWLSDRKPVNFTSSFTKGLEELSDSLHLLVRGHHAQSSPAPQAKKVYVSYSTRDAAAEAERVVNHLRGEGFDVWFDKDILPGSSWALELERSMQECDVIVVLLSPGANQSNYIQRELVYMQDLRKPIIPVIIKQPVRVPYVLAGLQYLDLSQDLDSGLAKLNAALHPIRIS